MRRPSLLCVAAQCYPSAVRGTGVGLNMAIGRLGSIAEPLLVGMLLFLGRTSNEILYFTIPVAVVGGLALCLLHAADKRKNRHEHLDLLNST